MKLVKSQLGSTRDAVLSGHLSTFARLILEAQGGASATGQVGHDRQLERALIDQLPDFLFIKDVQSRFLVANKAIATAYGRSSPKELIGKTDFDLHPEEVARQFFDIEQQVISTGVALEDLEETFPDHAGIDRWYSTIKVPLRDCEDKIIGLVGVCRDITERKLMELVRLQQGEILELIAKNAPLEPVLSRLVQLIESQLCGIRGSILLYEPADGSLRVGAAPSLPQAYNAALDGIAIGPKVGSCGTAAYRGQSVIVTDIQSDPLWEAYRELAASFALRSCWSTPIMSHDGSLLGTFAMYSGEVRSPNATETGVIEATIRLAGIAIERQQSEARFRFIAHHDALTGLPNRTLLNERLLEAMRRADRESGSVSVIFVDLDDFKFVNDSLGHLAADKLLVSLAARMLNCVSPSDSVLRIGGDEFVVISYTRSSDADSIGQVVQSLKAAISAPICIEGRLLEVTCSIGIAIYPKDGTDAKSLLIEADLAMYSAKENGRDDFRFFSAEMNDELQERRLLQYHLRNALHRGEFHLAYQPLIDLRCGRIFGAEALIRWKSPDLGDVPPARFIPAAEESGLIVSIGSWVLRTACRQNRAWQLAGAHEIVMSVNVSPRQFKDSGWSKRVEDALRESDLEPRLLELEVTESMIMHDLQGATSTMGSLKATGVQLSIDDFGTGFSSLSALKNFPVSRLKIDRSFVRDLPRDENDKAIAAAVISLGQKLGLAVIAEGIETAEQLSFLRENNCLEGQGFMFSKPITGEAFELLLKAQALNEAMPLSIRGGASPIVSPDVV